MAEPVYYYSNISNGYSIHSDGEAISPDRVNWVGYTFIYNPALTSTMAQFYAPFQKVPKAKLTLKELLADDEDN